MWIKVSKRIIVNTNDFRNMEVDSNNGKYYIKGHYADNTTCIIFEHEDVERCERVLSFIYSGIEKKATAFDTSEFK